MAFIGFALAFVLASPSWAYAFGPLTHLAVGLPILEDAFKGVLPAAWCQPLTNWPLAYLYGLLGPDITIARNLADFHSHCHNWRVGKEVLAKARSLKEEAFALGYLSHLAHDTYAHNLFLPKKILFGNPRYLSRHIPTEIILDGRFANLSFLLKLLREIIKDKDLEDLLERTVTPVVFSFRTNQFFFRRLLAFKQSGKFDGHLKRLSDRHPAFLTEKEIDEAMEACYILTLTLVRDTQTSPIFRFDPTGVENLKMVRFFRRQIAHDSPSASAGFKLTLRQEVFELLKTANRPLVSLLEEWRRASRPLKERSHPQYAMPSYLLAYTPTPSSSHP